MNTKTEELGFDAFFKVLANLSEKCLAKYTPEQKKYMYECLVEHNRTAEKRFLERIQNRKASKELLKKT